MLAFILDPRTVMLVNLYWTAVIIAGSAFSIGAKMINWRHQTLKNVPSLMFVVMILLIMTVNMAAGIVQPRSFTNPATIVTNLGYSVYLLWFGMFRCGATYAGSIFNHKKLHMPVMFR